MDEPKKRMGRPPKNPDERLTRVTVFLLPRQAAKVAANGQPWLRALIDRSKGKPGG